MWSNALRWVQHLIALMCLHKLWLRFDHKAFVKPSTETSFVAKNWKRLIMISNSINFPFCREQYGGIKPPVLRSELDFDPGAKYHVPANVPYMKWVMNYSLFNLSSCALICLVVLSVQCHWAALSISTFVIREIVIMTPLSARWRDFISLLHLPINNHLLTIVYRFNSIPWRCKPFRNRE